MTALRPRATSWYARAAEPLRSHGRVVRNTVGMVTGRSASLALGFVFWVVAARCFSADSFGLAAGAVSAMMLCTQLALLGVGSAFIAVWPRHPRRQDLIDSSLNVVIVASAVAGLIFVAMSAVLFHQLRVVSESPAYAVAFIVMTVLGTVNILLDQVSIAFGRGEQVLTRNVAFGVVGIVGVVGLGLTVPDAGSFQIFSIWVLSGIAACGIGLWQLFRAVRYRYRPALRISDGRELVRIGIPNHVLTLTERVPGFLLPIIATELLSPAKNAVWYPVWQMAWVAYIIPISAGMSLFAELAHDPQTLKRAVRVASRLSVALSLLAVLGLFVIGRPLLALLGKSYSHQGIGPLRILALGVIPFTVVEIYFGVCRAYGALREAIAIGVTMSIVSVAVAAGAARPWGLAGMAWTWVGTMVLAAAVAGVRVRQLTSRIAMSHREQRVAKAASPAQLFEEDDEFGSAVPRMMPLQSMVKRQ